MRWRRGETVGLCGIDCRIRAVISGDGVVIVIGAGMGFGCCASLGVVGFCEGDEDLVGFGRFWSCG